MYSITVMDNLNSAHYLRDYKGRSSNIHGHNWKIEMTIEGEQLNEIGWLADFSILKKALSNRTGNRFDYTVMNDHKPFDKINPTAENISRYIFEDIKASGLLPANARVKSVVVWENDKSFAKYEDK